MKLIKTKDSKYLIPIDMFSICEVDKKDRSQIIKLYKGRKNGAYYMDKFINHIKTVHDLSIQDYVENYLDIKWPLCPGNKIKVGFKVNGKGLIFSNYSFGGINKNTCKKFKESCEKMSKDRAGENNPMYNKNPWNKGLSKENHDSLQQTSKKLTGIKRSKKTRDKQSEIRKNHPLKARHTQKHSEESKQKMREATMRRWENGEFSNKKTEIELIVENFLKSNSINHIYQFGINGFVADFGLEDDKVVIECQGDFFHCNPKTQYKEAKHEIQKRNIYRDNVKRKIYKDEGWDLIELWESDIQSGKYKDILKCKLKKYFQ